MQKHLNDLCEAFALDTHGELWTYMSVGPFASSEEFGNWMEKVCASEDMVFFAIVSTRTQKAVGIASYLRIKPLAGSIEVGNITYSPTLKKTSMATEAMYLLMHRAFDELGYRRYEWKCDALNAPSRQAALRLGFQYDGLFKQALIYKGRNRDTAWFSILDHQWPVLKKAYLLWLDPSNFDQHNKQIKSLQFFMDQAGHV